MMTLGHGHGAHVSGIESRVEERRVEVIPLAWTIGWRKQREIVASKGRVEEGLAGLIAGKACRVVQAGLSE
ncbi:hypothetical protein VDBG_06046 [Verticillium alfalfae VaMs.102]|uniref:Uncharacterized protein n=1 Tax=Verticillium alfalfae (strain VaMs.102 / ATCC MYA-4576 / FGSC 10136) TaxID=526221 RepID=C9SMC2_VERA1|nr:hypothetical protein VDBG_06046 [Verticillium alfalfae VaMs.102]EEY19937.1 hypothetical protein VDBG_06046 [Verticillium alfalfae VaMs.102]